MCYCWNTLRWRNAVCIISLNLLAARTVEGMQNVDDPERCFSSLPASNLLKERLQLKNPSAVFHCLGRLKRYPSATLLYHTQVGFKPITQEDYCLTFGFTEEQFDNRWHGGVATIEESRGTDVWGVIWKMSKDNLDSLDKRLLTPACTAHWR
ncbi:uncharacterized protein LOC125719033 isoform X4 [Brienomyrus brachyistius]|uniref:uncharacterized protein LOC125719033 isoform X4 n=1 Tax=Brienomyrus brachyistius TaxID=42636 RepID=UPI0020B45E8F|nr:uncharacterized protein LOC125719033 isoform X4 [Brienomyrus brachyistius]